MAEVPRDGSHHNQRVSIRDSPRGRVEIAGSTRSRKKEKGRDRKWGKQELITYHPRSSPSRKKEQSPFITQSHPPCTPLPFQSTLGIDSGCSGFQICSS